eukprot:TRINITY_DN12030_c0_g1_i1.p1 TRINITY_DN12030_c0_g1~~TRINITY_DN12030_c0_g1_i1.p1  ORF type:complete len:612 (+),score=114.36 TRINITY_DN12030_c0_g1_i1:40-1875(+)
MSWASEDDQIVGLVVESKTKSSAEFIKLDSLIQDKKVVEVTLDSRSLHEGTFITHKGLLSSGSSVMEGPVKSVQQAVSLPVAGTIPHPMKHNSLDLVLVDSEFCFVGAGPQTDEASVRFALENDAFGTKRVALVRDLFDRNYEDRGTLSKVLKVVGKSAVVLESVLGSSNLKRRLVCEYVRKPSGKYVKSRNNVELGDYLDSQGFEKVIKISDEVCPKGIQLINIGNGKALVFSEKLASILSQSNINATVAEGNFDNLQRNTLVLRKSVDRTPIQNKDSSAEKVLSSDSNVPLYWASRSTLGGKSSQTTNSILMVAPLGFQTNIETAADNYFMHKSDESTDEIERKALLEFSELHMKFANVGVNILIHCPERFFNTPDATFPNNWFSTHPAGEVAEPTVALYPMKTPTRRAERRQYLISEFQTVYSRELNFTHWEAADIPQFYESTGVIIMDRIRKIAYCNISERCSEVIAKEWGRRLGYEMVLFKSVDIKGLGVYHTNVMMSVGSTLSVVCLDSVKDPKEKENLKSKLEKHHEVLVISLDQMNNFCGNVLEIQGSDGKRYMAMSTTAYNNFTQEQRDLMLKHVDGIIHSHIPTIETIGGGSVRCMLGELF